MTGTGNDTCFKPICQSFQTTNVMIDTMFLCFCRTNTTKWGLTLASKMSVCLYLDKSSDIYLDFWHYSITSSRWVVNSVLNSCRLPVVCYHCVFFRQISENPNLNPFHDLCGLMSCAGLVTLSSFGSDLLNMPFFKSWQQFDSSFL